MDAASVALMWDLMDVHYSQWTAQSNFTRGNSA